MRDYKRKLQNVAGNNTGLANFGLACATSNTRTKGGTASNVFSVPSSGRTALSGKTHRPRTDEYEYEFSNCDDLLPLFKKTRPTCKGRGGPKTEDEQALKEFIAKQPYYQTLSKHIVQQKLDELVNIGLKFNGCGLKMLFFSDGPMIDFCCMIALYNGARKLVVKKSKMKMLKTWVNQHGEYYTCDSELLSAANITLTVKGKHNLLMHIETEEGDDNSHALETLCRNSASDVMRKLSEFSCSLQAGVETVNQCTHKTKTTEEKNQEQNRQQRKIMCDKHGCSEKQAGQKLRGAAKLLYEGLFPEKKSKRKNGKPKMHTAVEMVLMANPGKTKKQIHSRGITKFANEPVLHANLLQRSAVTYKMSKGMDHRKAHMEVGQSNGIDLMALFGFDKDANDQTSTQELAKLCFDKVTGFEHFGRQQQLLQIGPGP